MPKIDQLVSAYIQVRDQVAELEAAHKERIKPYKAALEKLELDVLQALDEAGVESMKTKFGTAYKSQKTSVTVADRSAFMDYVKAHQAFELLDVRPSKTAVENFLAEHQDVPPGVNLRRVVACNFRRS